MSFTSWIRMCMACATLSIAMGVFPGLATADECAANVEHITFKGTTSPLQLVFFDTILECVDLVVDDFTFGNKFPMTIVAFDDKGQTMRSDALVMFNATNGPNGANVANICLWSNEKANGASNCDDIGNITKLAFTGEPEVLRAQLNEKWTITLTSGTLAQGNQACKPFGAMCSDVGLLAPVPEPGTVGLLVIGLIGLACGGRRRILSKDV